MLPNRRDDAGVLEAAWLGLAHAEWGAKTLVTRRSFLHQLHAGNFPSEPVSEQGLGSTRSIDVAELIRLLFLHGRHKTACTCSMLARKRGKSEGESGRKREREGWMEGGRETTKRSRLPSKTLPPRSAPPVSFSLAAPPAPEGTLLPPPRQHPPAHPQHLLRKSVRASQKYIQHHNHHRYTMIYKNNYTRIGRNIYSMPTGTSQT